MYELDSVLTNRLNELSIEELESVMSGNLVDMDIEISDIRMHIALYCAMRIGNLTTMEILSTMARESVESS